MAIIDNLNAIYDNYDLLMQMEQEEPVLSPRLSSRIRLDINAYAPLIVIPLSSLHDQSIVLDLGRIEACNSFLIVQKPTEPSSTDPCYATLFSPPTCKFCGQESVETALDALEYPKSARQSHAAALVDEIKLSLRNMSVWVGERRQCLKDRQDKDLLFSAFLIRLELDKFICRQFSLEIKVQRNLSSAFPSWSELPNWKVDLQLSKISFRITNPDFRLLRGILSHNLGDCAHPSQNTVAKTALAMTDAATNSDKLSMFITLQMYSVELQLCDSACFSKICFIHSSLSYQTYESVSSAQLICQKINIYDNRSQDSVNNSFPLVLTADDQRKPLNDEIQVNIRYLSKPDGDLTTFIELNSLKFVLNLAFWKRFFTFIGQSVPEVDQPSNCNVSLPSKSAPSSMKISFLSRNSSLYIIRNFADLHSSAVVVKTDVCFQGRLHNDGNSWNVYKFNFHLHDAVMSTCLLLDETLTRVNVIEPFSFTVCLVPIEKRNHPEDEHGKAQYQLHLGAPLICSRFAYTDGLLFMEVFNSLQEQLPAKSESMQDLSKLSTESNEPWLLALVKAMTDSLRCHTDALYFSSSFSLCFIDDCLDADVPIGEISLLDATLDWNLHGDSEGKISTLLSVDYYNRDLASWEPAIEPWRFQLAWIVHEQGSIASFSLTSQDTFNFNLTIPLLHLVQMIPQKIAADRSDSLRQRTPFVPFKFSNQTGEKIWFRPSNSQLELLEPDAESESTDDFNTWFEAPSDTTQIDLPFKAAQNSLDSLEDRLSLPLPSKTRLVIEVVRQGSAQNLVIVRSGLTASNQLSPGHTLEIGFQPYDPQPAERASSVGSKTTVLVCRLDSGQSTSIPIRFAAYSSANLGEFRFRPCFESAKVFSWSKVYLPKATASSEVEPGMPATSVAGNLNWTELKKPGDLLDCLVYNEPITDSRHLGLSSFSVPNDGEEAKQDNYYMCVSCVRDVYPVAKSSSAVLHPVQLPSHHFTIGALLKVTNHLPCDMVYFLKNTTISAMVEPGKNAYVTQVDHSLSMKFGVKLEGFDECQCLEIPWRNYSSDILMKLFDKLHRPLDVRVRVRSKAFGPRHLTVSAVCWILNRSGLPLVFSQCAGSSNSAGQFEENECARQAAPYLYSFPNKEEGNFVRVRVGKGFKPANSSALDKPFNAPWSPRLNLSVNGVDNLQLKLRSNSNRFVFHSIFISCRSVSVFDIGVEVQDGKDCLQNTKIVTLKPRFVIENKSPFKLEFIQQFSESCKTFLIKLNLSSHFIGSSGVVSALPLAETRFGSVAVTESATGSGR
ncbi:hypothetical protein Ciccas_002896 [Cichlidogyrus casuarinus]|uniref:Vacuolar protein sorting-associated protein 13 VPS13 adaptor binding domain-containing protein n=1 Tax=Cichlidogyrus casuarinus TaxID=1844966 RepID=A0ABD2QFY6_9PLAT